MTQRMIVTYATLCQAQTGSEDRPGNPSECGDGQRHAECDYTRVVQRESLEWSKVGLCSIPSSYSDFTWQQNCKVRDAAADKTEGRNREFSSNMTSAFTNELNNQAKKSNGEGRLKQYTKRVLPDRQLCHGPHGEQNTCPSSVYMECSSESAIGWAMQQASINVGGLESHSVYSLITVE